TTHHRRRDGLALPRGGAAALAARGLLLRGRAALAGGRAGRARARLLAAAARRARGVRDARGALLRHPLLLQLLVLLLVFDRCSFTWHVRRFPLLGAVKRHALRATLYAWTSRARTRGSRSTGRPHGP